MAQGKLRGRGTRLGPIGTRPCREGRFGDLFRAQSFVVACKPLSLPTRTIIYLRARYNALTEGITAIDRTCGSRGPVQSTRLSQVTTGLPKR